MINLRYCLVFVLFLSAITALIAESANDMDCESIRAQVKQERNLLKRRTLLEQAVKDCPDDSRINCDYAYSLERLRKYDLALSYYLRATELDSQFSDAYMGAGDIYMVLGNAESAIKAYERGLAIDPENSRGRRALDLAQIKHRAELGQDITADEFVRVMEESKSEPTTPGAIDGPIVRMQIQFLSGSEALTEGATHKLDIVGEALQQEALSEARFEVAGHTDDVGGDELNLDLSKRRAEAVRDYLVSAAKIDTDRLIVTFYGETRPALPNTSSENRAINRRVEFKRLK